MEKEIYTAYAPNADITFIMCDTLENGEVVSAEVVGFYYGQPCDELTKEYTGKLKATLEMGKG